MLNALDQGHSSSPQLVQTMHFPATAVCITQHLLLQQHGQAQKLLLITTNLSVGGVVHAGLLGKTHVAFHCSHAHW